MDYFLASQICGITAIAINAIGGQFPKREYAIGANLIGKLFWILHSYLLDAPVAVFNALINILRGLFFLSPKYKTSWLVGGLFIGFYAINTCLNYRMWFDVLPGIASTIIIFSYASKTDYMFRIFQILSCFVYFPYAYLIGSPINMLSETMYFVSFSLSLYRFHYRKKK